MSATTSVDHEGAHDESTNRSAEKHRKNQGKLEGPKRGVFGAWVRGWVLGTKWRGSFYGKVTKLICVDA